MEEHQDNRLPISADRLSWWEDIPLGLALLAQSYVVGLWYYASVRGANERLDLAVAIGAGLALDLIVVTTVMGRRQGRSSGWSWATSFGAFLCSSLIALDRYGWEWRSLLHVAFPLVVFLYSQHLATPRKLVAFGYTMNMHAPTKNTVTVGDSDDDIPLSKTAKVRARMLSDGVSESTAWRRVKADELSMNGKEH